MAPPSSDNRSLPPSILSHVFDASPSAMLLVDAEGRIRLANREAERLFGHRRGGLTDQAVETLVPAGLRPQHVRHREQFFEAPSARAMGAGRDLYGVCEDGREVPIEIGLNPIGDASTGERLVLAAIVDLTARKENELRLQGSLEEKETLLREVHHRVKNNMQVVSSLLSLQLGKVDTEKSRALFEECQMRVRTMALIHEKLYGAGDLSTLDGRDYLADLVVMMQRTYLTTRPGITVKTDIATLDLDIHNAIPVGLILHELFMNAAKHAFTGRKVGSIHVRATQTADLRVALSVDDDGIGRPADLPTGPGSGLGLRMVERLTSQLDGSLTYHVDGGTHYELQFDNATKTHEPR